MIASHEMTAGELSVSVITARPSRPARTRRRQKIQILAPSTGHCAYGVRPAHVADGTPLGKPGEVESAGWGGGGHETASTMCSCRVIDERTAGGRKMTTTEGKGALPCLPSRSEKLIRPLRNRTSASPPIT